MSISIKEAFQMYQDSRIDQTLENAFYAGGITVYKMLIAKDIQSRGEILKELKEYVKEHPSKVDLQ